MKNRFSQTRFLEPDCSNQISRTRFLEPPFYNFLEKWLQIKWSIGLKERGVINLFFIFCGKKQVCKVNYGHYIIFRIENYHVEKGAKKVLAWKIG